MMRRRSRLADRLRLAGATSFLRSRDPSEFCLGADLNFMNPLRFITYGITAIGRFSAAMKEQLADISQTRSRNLEARIKIIGELKAVSGKGKRCSTKLLNQNLRFQRNGNSSTNPPKDFINSELFDDEFVSGDEIIVQNAIGIEDASVFDKMNKGKTAESKFEAVVSGKYFDMSA